MPGGHAVRNRHPEIRGGRPAAEPPLRANGLLRPFARASTDRPRFLLGLKCPFALGGGGAVKYDDGGTRQRVFGTFRTESVVPRKNAATEPRISSIGLVQDPESPWT